MVEPVSTIAAVGAVYSGLKAAISVGKDMSSLAKDIGTVFDAIDGARSAHKKESSRKGTLSANQEALNTFIEKKQADDMEEELRELIITCRGFSAWNELVQLRADVRVKRKQEAEAARKARAEKIEAIITYSIIFVSLACLVGVLVIALMYSLGRL